MVDVIRADTHTKFETSENVQSVRVEVVANAEMLGFIIEKLQGVIARNEHFNLAWKTPEGGSCQLIIRQLSLLNITPAGINPQN